MNPQDPSQQLLQQLLDIEAPAPIGWWPLAPGWWVVIALFCLLAFYLGFKIYVWWQAQRYRREALHQFKKLQSLTGKPKAEALITLLKRCAFSAYPQARHHIAGLYGEAFFAFLQDQLTPKNRHDIKKEWYHCLYTKSNIEAENLQALATFTLHWIKKHQQQALLNRDTFLVTNSAHNSATTTAPTPSLPKQGAQYGKL